MQSDLSVSKTPLDHLNLIDECLNQKFSKYKSPTSTQIKTQGTSLPSLQQSNSPNPIQPNKIGPLKPKHSFLHTVWKVAKIITGVWVVNKIIKHFHQNAVRAKMIDNLSQMQFYDIPPSQASLSHLMQSLAGIKDNKAIAEKLSLFIQDIPEECVDPHTKLNLNKLISEKKFDSACELLKKYLAINKFKKAGPDKLNKYSAKFLRSDEINSLEQILTEKSIAQESISGAYDRLFNVNSKITVYKWLTKLVRNGELTENKKNQFVDLLKNNDSKAFAIELKQMVSERMDASKKEGLNARYFFWKELKENLDKKNPKNAIADIAMLLGHVKFYDRMIKPLAQLNQMMISVYGQLKLQEINSGDPAVLSKIGNISKKIDELESAYQHIISNDSESIPLLRYQIAAKIGNIRSQYREVNDHYSGILGVIQGIKNHQHTNCGCHYAFAGVEAEKAKGVKTTFLNLMPNQIVDVVKNKLMLEGELLNIQKQIAQLEKESSQQPETLAKIEKLKEKEEKYAGELNKLKEYALHHSKLVPMSDEHINSRKSVFIATCSYGGGHNSAAEAAAKYLGAKGAHVSVADFSKDVLLEKQLTHRVGRFFGKKHWNDPYFFNYLAQNQYTKALNFYAAAGKIIRKIFGIKGKTGTTPPSPNEDSTTKALIRERLLKEMPDQIITVYHMDLHPILEVAEELGIPVVHIATDLDIKAKTLYENKGPDYNYFKAMVPYGLEKVLNSAAPIKKEQIVVGGAPVRPDFLTYRSTEQIAQLKKERGLDPDTKVVLIMGGANGNIVPYPEMLTDSKTWDQKTHVIVIAGSNEEFRKQLEEGKLKKKGNYFKGSNEHVTIEVARDPIPADAKKPCFLRGAEISKLQDMADAVITKPGGLTTMEALYKGTPLIFDHRSELLSWEEDTVEQVVGGGRGVDNRKENAFEADLKKALLLGKDTEGKTFNKLATDQNLCNTIADLLDKAEADPTMKAKRYNYKFHEEPTAFATIFKKKRVTKLDFSCTVPATVHEAASAAA